MTAVRHGLSPYQRDLWTASSYLPHDPQFVQSMIERITGPVDAGLLRECAERALRRNDCYHLRFGDTAGVPYQWTDPDLPPVELVDLSGEPDPRAAARAWCERTVREPFRLDGGPMAQATVLSEGPEAASVVVRVHHMVADGWALTNVLGEVFTDYAHTLRTGRPAEFAAPSFLEVLRDEPAYRDDPAEEAAHRDLLLTALDGAEPPLFTRRAPSGSRTSSQHAFHIEHKTLERVREHGVSRFSYLAAAMATYLARVHGSDEVCLGVPLLNRTTPAQLATGGHFANTLPLRVRVAPDATLLEVARQIGASSRTLKSAERYPLGRLLGDLRTAEGRPRRMYDALFSMLRFPATEQIPGTRREMTAVLHAQDLNALVANARHRDDGGDLEITYDYADDVFDADLPIERAAEHLQQLVTGGLEELRTPARRLRMLSDAEHEQVVRGPHNDTRVAFSERSTLHGLLAEQAARTPGAPALADAAPDAAPLTFRDVDRRSDAVAEQLRALGAGPGDRVALLLGRGADTVAAALGVLKSGAAYLPVDPALPAARVAFLLDDGSPSVVVHRGATDLLPPALPAVDLATVPAAPTDGAPGAARGTAADAAYVIHTSGSSGTPKGVVVEHRSVVNRLEWMQRRYPLHADDVVLHKTPLSFDVSIWELFWSLLAGARQVVLEPGAERDPRELQRAVADHGVTTLHFVPSMLGPWLDLLETEPALRAGAASLRRVFCSGEALPPAHVARFHAVLGPQGPELVNLYGPTEATVDVTHHDCPPAEAGRATVPIGRPIDNTRVLVLDRDGRPQPGGVAGELCVAGVGVARGYLNRPELTAERFAPDPFEPDERLYRTGDLARLLADGTVEYLGRTDAQVKINGWRVEPGEVRAAVAACPGVRRAEVAGETAPDGRTRLVCYVVPADAEQPVTAADLYAHCAARLPAPLVPSRFVALDDIPLTASGKADLRAAAARAAGSGSEAAAGTAPRDAGERTLAEVWGEVLGTPVADVHANYYALGGDSIQLLRIRALMERRGLAFDLTELMRFPTVAALAPRLRPVAEPAAGDPVGTEPFALVGAEDRALFPDAADAHPMTRLQLGMVYHTMESPGTAMYHDVFRYVFRTRWQESAFRAAHERLTRRHPALRSSFDLLGADEPLQVVHRTVAGGLTVTDLRSAAPGDPEAQDALVLAEVERARARRYDLASAPLHHLHAHVTDTGVQLVLAFHHALLDGWSVARLVEELMRDYLHATGAPVEPPAREVLPSQAWHAADERAAEADGPARDHWRSLLRGAQATTPLPDRPHTARTEPGPIRCAATVPAPLLAALGGLTAAHGVPLKSLLLAAHCLTLRLHSGTGPDVTTGMVTHGRPERSDADALTGLFLNTVPVRLDDTGRSRLGTAQHLLAQEQAGHPHRMVPLSAVQEDFGGPVLETAFNFTHFHGFTALHEVPGFAFDSFDAWEETNFVLLLNAVLDPTGSRLEIRVEADGTTLTADHVERYSRTFLAVLQRLADHPDENADFAFLTEPPRPPAPVAGRPTVMELLARQVDRVPEAVAVSAADGRWSYREMDERARQIAAALLRHGVRPRDRVVVALERSFDLVASVLGIGMAGGACVPVEPGHPAARLAGMVATTAPTAVIAPAGAEPEWLADHSLLVAPPAADTAPAEPARLPAVTAEDTAFVLFTSGSTGGPKGVALSHGALSRLITWQLGDPGGVVRGTTLQFAPLTFDASFHEIWTTFAAGGTLRLIGDEERRDSRTLLRALDEGDVERVFVSYVALHQLAETAVALDRFPSRLRVIVCAGEQLRVTPAIRTLLRHLDDPLLINAYGPTEAHVVTRALLDGPPDLLPDLPAIGTPAGHCEILVLDEAMRPVPDGGLGEVYIGGDCLADGYEGNPGLTRERFVPHPWGPPGARLYRSGDLGHVLPDGNLVYVGRADRQCKIRGHRVEPAEVEAELRHVAAQVPSVGDVAVVVGSGPSGSFLAGFLVGEAPEEFVGQVRSALRARVPDHLVPATVTCVPRLPLTASGKRDDRALLELRGRQEDAPRDATAPADDEERSVARVVTEVLGLPSIGVHEDLFDRGCTSLHSVRIVTLLQERTGVDVPLPALVREPTVAQLAVRVRQAENQAHVDPVVTLRDGGANPPLFLVHPIGGSVVCYQRLLPHLPHDRPVHALQAVGDSGEAGGHSTMADIAAAYVREIRRVRPHGPYLLSGWSFGGLVAFEMGRQLREAGEEVPPVVLIDPIALRRGEREGLDEGIMLAWFFWELLLPHHRGERPMEALPPELTDERERTRWITRAARRAGALPEGMGSDVVHALYRTFVAHWRATLAYRPEGADDDVVLLRSTEPLPDVLREAHERLSTAHRDDANGWREWTSGEVRVVEVGGDHLTLMEEPHVATVGRWITTLLGGDGTAGAQAPATGGEVS
ncbi:amino acid adenylation domain-containing protein [Streptomyces lonarensis]|uniref:Amino acid adenylation domain-containing protein n=1 Tax=Streptomyces lonarensis TaxID=700599 RepID=A0A7X6CYC6_9ACTN|nr:non-ribosomal peptide synthetase [Streptomyces lonarensis]NJQ04836.1 amino acid adenylation domain-containing protein [Streptomyces lonarensis]